jgi:hypothetical protein
MAPFHVSSNVSVSNLQLWLFIGYGKLGQTLKGAQLSTMVFVEFCGFNQFDFTEQ